MMTMIMNDYIQQLVQVHKVAGKKIRTKNWTFDSVRAIKQEKGGVDDNILVYM